MNARGMIMVLVLISATLLVALFLLRTERQDLSGPAQSVSQAPGP